MGTLLILVAGATAAVLLFRVAAARRPSDPRPFELGSPELAAEDFSFGPSAVEDDRPARLLSVLRVAFFIAALGALTAGLAWLAGAFLNARLHEYLRGIT